MWILAATRAESAASAIGLAVLSSCVLLAIYRPRRTELDGTLHHVPVMALVVAIGWAMLAAHAVFSASPSSSTENVLSFGDLWLVCALNVVEIAIIAAAYLIPRAVNPPPAPQLSPVPPVETTADVVTEETASEVVTVGPKRTFVPPDWPDHIAVGITVGLAALLPTALLGSFLAPERDLNDSHILLRTLQGQGWEILTPIILAAAILAPLKEELLFRVVFQGWFADRVGKLAIPLTAGVFALIHGPKDAALLIPLSLMLGALFEYRRSYLEVVAAHAAFNSANLFVAVNAF